MVVTYTIASGKGGTGKTTLSVNLGTMLAHYGEETYILDADMGMANISIILGLENVPVTLHEVLAGKAHVSEAIYEGPCGVKVIPSGISLQGFQNANPENLHDVMKDIINQCDVLIMDAPAGISRDGVIPLAIADEVILVINPELSSMVDALKTKILTELIGGHIKGAILNRATLEKTELSVHKIEEVLGVKVIGLIPDDPNVRRSAAYKIPIVVKYPNSPASVEIKKIAAELAGVEYKKSDTLSASDDKFLDRLARSITRRKK
ncbi:septum site-determining protein MinD [Methanomicrobium sp. W14]|uniref:cell division ATPase MinD n=1 Tax=Methanomicrobium sp. W14 TaxID=2817839 RepID=UPI001AE374E8|nr:cell division ATPase MinD [Methanomicrobium sp. W14]MBP2132722.1 septum site-determining protein MinD [Methanomicrobium sp. W14]